jgi:hypothetical protein
LTIIQAGKGEKKGGGGGLLVENTFVLECVCVCKALGTSDVWLFVCVIPNGRDGTHFETDNLHIEKNKHLQAA